MKNHIVPSSTRHLFISLRLTIATLILFGVIYPLVISGIAWTIGKDKGNMELIGQSFTSDRYFNGRPSAVNYNAAATGGSNKGPANPDYLKQVEERIDDFLRKNPTVNRTDLPVDLVTASGGGLDPHISIKSALVQVDRIAKARKLSNERINQLIQSKAERPFLGPSHINVLKLNKALDQL
jgi:K+-transporting ATPase ATPase C chain